MTLTTPILGSVQKSFVRYVKGNQCSKCDVDRSKIELTILSKDAGRNRELGYSAYSEKRPDSIFRRDTDSLVQDLRFSEYVENK